MLSQDCTICTGYPNWEFDMKSTCYFSSTSGFGIFVELICYAADGLAGAQGTPRKRGSSEYACGFLTDPKAVFAVSIP